jgi:hypothetical protein
MPRLFGALLAGLATGFALNAFAYSCVTALAPEEMYNPIHSEGDPPPGWPEALIMELRGEGTPPSEGRQYTVLNWELDWDEQEPFLILEEVIP